MVCPLWVALQIGWGGWLRARTCDKLYMHYLLQLPDNSLYAACLPPPRCVAWWWPVVVPIFIPHVDAISPDRGPSNQELTMVASFPVLRCPWPAINCLWELPGVSSPLVQPGGVVYFVIFAISKLLEVPQMSSSYKSYIRNKETLPLSWVELWLLVIIVLLMNLNPIDGFVVVLSSCDTWSQ